MITLKTLNNELEYLTLDTIIKDFTVTLSSEESININDMIASNDDDGILYFDTNAKECLKSFIETGYNIKELYNRFLYNGGYEYTLYKSVENNLYYIVSGDLFNFDNLYYGVEQ